MTNQNREKEKKGKEMKEITGKGIIMRMKLSWR